MKRIPIAIVFLIFVSLRAQATVVEFKLSKECKSKLAGVTLTRGPISYALLAQVKEKERAETLAAKAPVAELNPWILGKALTHEKNLTAKSQQPLSRLMSFIQSESYPQSVPIQSAVYAIKSFNVAFPNDPTTQDQINDFVTKTSQVNTPFLFQILEDPFSFRDVVMLISQIRDPKTVALFLSNAINKAKNLAQGEALFLYLLNWFDRNQSNPDDLNLDLVFEALYFRAQPKVDPAVLLIHFIDNAILNPPEYFLRLTSSYKPENMFNLISPLFIRYKSSALSVQKLKNIRDQFPRPPFGVAISRLLLRLQN